MTWILLLAILIAVILVPRYGLLAVYKDWQGARQRELVEDALKHLLDREQSGRHASPESLAGTLGEDAPRLVEATRRVARLARRRDPVAEVTP